jgi:hypothetical protein
MRRYFRNVGGLCGIFSLLMGTLSTLMAWFNVDGSFPRPMEMALVFGTFWSAFFLLGAYLLLLYHKYRLFVQDHEIRQIGVFTERVVNSRLIQEIQWRRFPQGGSVRITNSTDVLKIELGNFEAPDRETLIAHLRQAVDDAKQVGWEAFSEQFADTPQKRQRARRARLLLAIFFIGHAVAFFIVFLLGIGGEYLGFSIVNVILGGYLIRRHLQERRSAMRIRDRT